MLYAVLIVQRKLDNTKSEKYQAHQRNLSDPVVFNRLGGFTDVSSPGTLLFIPLQARQLASSTLPERFCIS